jgi:hypothetical protein
LRIIIDLERRRVVFGKPHEYTAQKTKKSNNLLFLL